MTQAGKKILNKCAVGFVVFSLAMHLFPYIVFFAAVSFALKIAFGRGRLLK